VPFGDLVNKLILAASERTGVLPDFPPTDCNDPFLLEVLPVIRVSRSVFCRFDYPVLGLSLHWFWCVVTWRIGYEPCGAAWIFMDGRFTSDCLDGVSKNFEGFSLDSRGQGKDILFVFLRALNLTGADVTDESRSRFRT